MSLSSQEREDAETIGFQKSEIAQAKSNIETLFTKFDQLSDEMHNLSIKVQVMIVIASIFSPILYSIFTHYGLKTG